jgi:hypothetical protein
MMQVEHREILNNRLFFKKLIEYICDKPKKIKSPAQLTVRGKKYLSTCVHARVCVVCVVCAVCRVCRVCRVWCC